MNIMPRNTADALEIALFWLMTVPEIIAPEDAADRMGVTQQLAEFIEAAHEFTRHKSPERWRLHDMLNGRKIPASYWREHLRERGTE